MSFTIRLGADYCSLAPEFHCYDHASTVAQHMLSEGATIVDCVPAEVGRYEVTTVKTSSIAGLNLSSSPSPSSASCPIPSSSGDVATTSGNGDVWCALFALLAIPMISVACIAVFMKQKGKTALAEPSALMMPSGSQKMANNGVVAKLNSTPVDMGMSTLAGNSPIQYHVAPLREALSTPAQGFGVQGSPMYSVSPLTLVPRPISGVGPAMG